MPLLPVLAPTSQAGLRVYASHLHPKKVHYREARSHWDVETSVPVQNRRRWALNTLTVDDEHGDFRPIPAFAENLLDLEVVWVYSGIDLPEEVALSGFDVVSID